MSDQWFADIIGNAAFEDVRQSLGLEATEEQRRLKQMAALAARMRESQRRRPKAKARNQNAHLRSIAVEVGILAPHADLRCVRPVDCEAGALQIFPRRPDECVAWVQFVTGSDSDELLRCSPSEPSDDTRAAERAVATSRGVLMLYLQRLV